MLQNARLLNWNSLIKLSCLIVLVLLCCTITAQAEQEEILYFHSDITVREDSDLLVRETIKVRVLGRKIKRGIFRDFPVKTKDFWGLNKKVEFKVLSVSKNGTPENYTLEDITGGMGGSSGKRIRIGNKNTFLSHGVYTYQIEYKTSDQLGYFENYDELYWNVTGNGWDFPIRNASATITLPAGVFANSVNLAGFTGSKGSKASDLIASKDNYNYNFETTSRLGSKEGLTIVVNWPKGFITEPTASEVRTKLINDNKGVLVGFLGLLLVIIYYVIAWFLVGRDPRKGIVIPRYEAPADMSPAEVRYLYKMAFDKKSLAAEILQMATSGFISIEQIDRAISADTYKLIKNKEKASRITNLQQKVAQNLFKSSPSIELVQSSHARLQAAILVLKNKLKVKFLKKHFYLNRKYLITGVVLSLVTLLSAAALDSPESIFIILFMSVWLSGWSIGVSFLVSATFSLWKDFFETKSGLFSAIASTCFAVPFIGGEIAGISMLYVGTSFYLFILIILMIALGFLFQHLLKAPTIRGQRVMDEIEGFKLYLSVAEQDRLARYRGASNAPDKTIEVFEKFLPYAFALDVEQEWSEQFSDVITKASLGGEYQPHFFHGGSFATTSHFSSSFNSSFSSAIASSSTSPSSGGSGGGGFSGGGGGGGGGGGW